jgi:hypothetical protein
MIARDKVENIKKLADAARGEKLEFEAAFVGSEDERAAAWSAQNRLATEAYQSFIWNLPETDLRDVQAFIWHARGDNTFSYCRKHSEDFKFDDDMRRYVTNKPLYEYLPRILDNWPPST